MTTGSESTRAFRERSALVLFVFLLELFRRCVYRETADGRVGFAYLYKLKKRSRREQAETQRKITAHVMLFGHTGAQVLG